MNKSALEDWLKKLGNAWSKRDPKAAASLFSKDCRYYEAALEKPCKSWNDILSLWLVVPKNQKGIKFSFKLLSTSGNTAVANWKVTRTLIPGNEKQQIDGIFQISLNDKGLCTFFKQWRTVKKVG